MRSSSDYPHPAFARLDALGDPDHFYRRLSECTVCGVYVYDLEAGHNVYVNPQYTKLLGYTLAELDALDAEAFLALFHPADVDRVLAHMAAVGERSDGEPVPIEYRFRHKAGPWVWCRSYDLAFERGPDGKMRRFIGSFVDITDVMAAQDALAQFTRMAAHDLRAPTRRIRQYVELLGDELAGELTTDARVLLSSIDAQAEQMTLLVAGLRGLTSMTAPGHRTATDLAQLVDSVLDALPAPLAGRSVEVRRDPLPTLELHPELVRTLYTHLVTNALLYGSEPLRLEFTAETVDEQVVLGVRNSGSAFPAELLESVFVPFRRGRRRSLGVGLGLPICKRIVDLHHGRIWIESEPGHPHVRFTLRAEGR